MENRYIAFRGQKDHVVIGYITSNDDTGRVRAHCVYVDDDGVLQTGKTKLPEDSESKFTLLPLDSFLHEYAYYFRDSELSTLEALKSLASSLGVYPHLKTQDDVDLILTTFKKNF